MSRLRRWSASTLLARALLVVLPLVAVAAAGQRPATAFVVVLVAMGVLWAALPESPAGQVVLVLVMAWWGLRVDDPLAPGALVAAAALLGAHLAAVVTSYGPGRMGAGRALPLLWVRRGLLALLVAPVAWVAARGVDSAPDQPTLWAVALLTVAGLVVAAGMGLRTATSD